MNTRLLIRKSTFIIFLMVNIVLLTLVSITLAKYTQKKNIVDNLVFEDFDASIYKINGFDLSELKNNGKLDSNGVITLTRAEYENFSLSIKYKGKGKSFIRILISESWSNRADDVQTVVPAGLSNYTFENVLDKIHDNRVTDGYLYLEGPTNNNSTASNDERIINVISGATAIPLGEYTSTQVKIIIKIDAVQYNRYKALWNITDLPY